MNHLSARPRSFGTALALGLILAAYAYARILEIAHGPVPRLAVVALNVLSALAFALVHGALHYRVRGILIFAAICTVAGNLAENVGVATGFPFGRYYFAELMGPKLFHVPILLGLAYIGMAHVSWMLARLMVGNSHAPIAGLRVVILPLVASFILVAWDLAQDPIWATVLHGWIWLDGGPWFGVPISNYLGWFGTGFTIYLLFALYMRRCPAPAIPASQANWWPALLFYALCAAGNMLQTIQPAVPALVQDPTGTQWRVADIIGASALVSLFVMGAFVVLAGVKLAGPPRALPGEAATD
jgi:putative membrane protein